MRLKKARELLVDRNHHQPLLIIDEGSDFLHSLQILNMGKHRRAVKPLEKLVGLLSIVPIENPNRNVFNVQRCCKCKNKEL